MRNAAWLIALGAGLVMAVFWLQPAADGQAKPDLAEKFTPGLRRTATIARTYTQVIETLAGAEVEARQTQTIKTTALVHDWYPELNAQGWPARTVRTYRDLKRTQTTEDWTNGAEAVTTTNDTTPSWAGLVLTLETVDGELQVTGEAGGLNDFARASVAGEFETDLQPHRAREVGKGWKIRGSGVEPLRDNLDPAVYEDGVVTVTLKALDTVKATFEFSGSLKFRQKRADPDNPGQDVTNLLHESDLKGSAEFDVAAGRWLSRELTVESKLSGKRDGQTVQGTAKLTDQRRFVWGAIIDTAPDNGPIEGEGLTEHKVYAKGKIAPDKLVVGVASDKRSAIVEFDPASQKVTRTLVAFPPKVQYGNVALSPDRTKLAFASTLNNDLTLEPWNIFVLDLEAGKLNQITPEWASGEGLARLKEFKESTTLTVHIDPGLMEALENNVRLRSISHGEVFVEGYGQPVAFGGQDFKHFVHLEVPVGRVVVHVRGGADSHWKDPGYPIANQWLGSMEMTTEEKVGNSVQVKVRPRVRNGGFECPDWCAGRLVACLRSGHDAAAPTSLRSLSLVGQGAEVVTWPVIYGSAPIINARPDGKLLAVVGVIAGAAEQKPVEQVVFVSPGTAPVLGGVPLSSKANRLEPGVRGAWSPDGKLWVTGASITGIGVSEHPALVSIDPADLTRNTISEWPEMYGYRVRDIGEFGPDVWLVVLRHNTGSDVYEYSKITQSLRRLSSIGDVTTVASLGR